MDKNPRNHSGLFNLFAHDKPDKTGATLQKIGKLCFLLFFITGIIDFFTNNENSAFSNLILLMYVVGYFGGLLMFVATGIHYIGREDGKSNFLSSTAHLLKKTFLYLFLPSMI